MFLLYSLIAINAIDTYMNSALIIQNREVSIFNHCCLPYAFLSLTRLLLTKWLASAYNLLSIVYELVTIQKSHWQGMELQHLLVLCCYGGQPFVDFHLAPAHSSTQQIDPTDWQASDTAGMHETRNLNLQKFYGSGPIRNLLSSSFHSIECCSDILCFNGNKMKWRREHSYHLILPDLLRTSI